MTDGARAMARGELDQLVPAASRDELGDLANAFNEMARTLREYRQAGTARLLGPRGPPRPPIESFPDPVVVVDPDGLGRTGKSCRPPAAGREPRPESPVPWHPAQPLKSLISDVLAGRGDYLPRLARAGDPASRRRPGALLPAAGRGHSHRARRAARRRRRAWST